MDFSNSDIKKIQGTETPKKKFTIFQEAETLKKLLIFQETTFQPNPPKKIPFILGNGTF